MSVKIINGIKSLENAQDLFNDYKISLEDDFEDFGALSWACFHYQQAIELMLKGIIENYGVEPRFGHQLDIIIDQIRMEIPNVDIELINILDEIDNKNLSYILSSWEASNRYDEIMEFNAKDIENANEIANELKNFIEINKIK